MRRLSFLLLIFFVLHIPIILKSQISFQPIPSPKAGEMLYAKHVFFRWNGLSTPSVYTLKLKVSTGFRLENKTTIPAFIWNEYLDFGDTVYWEVWAKPTTSKTAKDSLIYSSWFGIRALPKSVSNKFRLNVKIPDSTGKEIILTDMQGLGFDKKGNIIWFLDRGPASQQVQVTRIMDLRLNPDGAITYSSIRITGGKLLRITLQNDTIFSYPNNKTPILKGLTFHHNVTPLSNGDYLAIANAFDGEEMNVKPGQYRKATQFVIRINNTGKVIWVWQTDAWLKEIDNDCYGHLNSADYDPIAQEVYVSMKDLNRIVRIDYRTGEVIGEVNGNDPHGPFGGGKAAIARERNPILREAQNLQMRKPDLTQQQSFSKEELMKNPVSNFSGQHSMIFSPKDTTLIMLNNNIDDPFKRPTSVMKIKIPKGKQEKPDIIWNKEIRYEDLAPTVSNGQGAVQITSSGNVFCYMGAVNRMFELDSKQKTKWMALSELYDSTTNQWQSLHGYKSYMASSLFPVGLVPEIINLSSGNKVFRISQIGSDSTKVLVSEVDKKGKVTSQQELSLSPGTTKDIPVKNNVSSFTICQLWGDNPCEIIKVEK
ncbi:MAG: hypothetical protein EBS07_07105 [Sphingobacteriia bacterium]|nr:hypothetical protein [Sphingobacteriia bacterium]